MAEQYSPALTPRIWQVGALCRAIADALEARFNPVAVQGEVTGFSRASSGHWYFSLKDAQGQLRCAMFRRAAGLMEFVPRDGEVIEARGRLGVYEPRGDLQLIVESLARAGQGALFEQFMRLKAKLEAEGLFDAGRKRPLPAMPKGIGIVTSLGAAALHDVVTCLQRRVPHIPVLLAPASVQGIQAPAELVRALTSLYRMALAGSLDVILLVRGGGSLDDLWAFNDEGLARAIVQSPVPLVSGVGHETDFSIADFCADVRAPTPTAAAELAAEPRSSAIARLIQADERLRRALWARLDLMGQQLDLAASRLGRPQARMSTQYLRLGNAAQRLRYGVVGRMDSDQRCCATAELRLRQVMQARLEQATQRLDRLRLRLELLDPRLVLERGYALLANDEGHLVSSVRHTHAGQALRATLADGEVALTVAAPRPFSS